MLPLRGRHEPIALECKWQAASFDPSALLAFRRGYPQGENYVVAPDVERAYTRTYTWVTSNRCRQCRPAHDVRVL